MPLSTSATWLKLSRMQITGNSKCNLLFDFENASIDSGFFFGEWNDLVLYLQPGYWRIT